MQSKKSLWMAGVAAAVVIVGGAAYVLQQQPAAPKHQASADFAVPAVPAGITFSGLGNPIVSMIEDGIAVITSVLAILLPILAVILFLLLAVFVWYSYRSVGKLIRRAKGPSRTPPPPPTLRQ